MPNVHGLLPASNKNKNKTNFLLAWRKQSNKLSIVDAGEGHLEANLENTNGFQIGWASGMSRQEIRGREENGVKTVIVSYVVV